MSDLQQFLPTDYWDNFEITQTDLEFLFNRLLELEEPQTADQLIEPLLSARIQQEKAAFNQRQTQESQVYRPREVYKTGQVLTFPALQWRRGKVNSLREGYNPQMSSFSVIEVEFEGDEVRQFACSLEEHKLNQSADPSTEENATELHEILESHGGILRDKLNEALETDPDLVRIAGCWFPKSLLIDINLGHLNLCEAVLEEVSGGPLATEKLVEQIEIPPNVNKRLVEFSMNYALQEDERFDEVGPTGETLWFLRRLEPDWVQRIPPFLFVNKSEPCEESLYPFLRDLEELVEDELSETDDTDKDLDEIDISLIFPHWRAGTLPLSSRITRFFPTADEAPRIQFLFTDADTSDQFSGWVVRPSSYVFGLKEWYEKHGLMPGSIIKLIRSDRQGEIRIHVEKRRQNREWVRTALIGADGGIVFAMLKQIVSVTFDERMAIAVPDVDAVDSLWKSPKQRLSLEASLAAMAQELTKLNPQGHIHAQELYACMNLTRRCPPSFIVQALAGSSKFSSLGNLYFRFADSHTGGSDD